MSTRRTIRSIAIAAVLGGALSSHALAASGGTEGALILTSTLTVVLIAILFLVLVLPAEDRAKIAAVVGKLRRFAIRGSTEQAMEFDHDFDGIRELDNRVPPWFTTLFLGTIVFGGAYLIHYHVVGSGKLMSEEYAEEVAAADLERRILIAREGTIDENTLTALTDPAALGRGKDQFGKYCVSCHGAQAGGVVGPNLTDDYWIHGGGIKNVYTTIKNGVPAKGMISWQLVFTPKQIQEIGSYVLSLKGTNPPGGKKPEGTLYVESASASVSATPSKPK
jgi:cytochrome c oxidase cbb3-type subunit 3